MLEWIRKQWLDAQAYRAQLQRLEQQAHVEKRQLNESLSLACNSHNPEVKVAHLLFAKSKLAQLKAITAEHPRMRLTNEQEVSEAIKTLEDEFSRGGYYAAAENMRKKSASAHVHLSPKAQELLR